MVVVIEGASSALPFGSAFLKVLVGHIFMGKAFVAKGAGIALDEGCLPENVFVFFRLCSVAHKCLSGLEESATDRASIVFV